MNAGQIVMMQMPGLSAHVDAQSTAAPSENGSAGIFAGLLTTLVPDKEVLGTTSGSPASGVKPEDDRQVVLELPPVPVAEPLAGMLLAMSDAVRAGMSPRADVRKQDTDSTPPVVKSLDAIPQNVVSTVAAVSSGAAAVIDSRMPSADSARSDASVPGVMPAARSAAVVMTSAAQAAITPAVDVAVQGEQTEQKPVSHDAPLVQMRNSEQPAAGPGSFGTGMQAAATPVAADTPEPRRALRSNIPLRDGAVFGAVMTARAESMPVRQQAVTVCQHAVSMPTPVHPDRPKVDVPQQPGQQLRQDTVVMPQPAAVPEQTAVKAEVAETVVPAVLPQGIDAQRSAPIVRTETQQHIALFAEKHNGMVESVATPPVAEQHDTPLTVVPAAVSLPTGNGAQATPLPRDVRERIAPLQATVPQPVAPPVTEAQATENTAVAEEVQQYAATPAKEAQPAVMAAAHRYVSARSEILPDTSKRQPDSVEAPSSQQHAGTVSHQAVMAVTEGESSSNVAEKAPEHAGESQPGMPVVHAAVKQERLHAATVATPPVSAEPLRNETTDPVVAQVKDRLAALEPKTGSDQIVLRLSPEHLGDLKLNLNMDGQRLKVEIVAENRSVRDALLQHADTLKESLARQNISMESFDVTTGGNSAGSFSRNQDGWKQQVWQRQQQGWTPPGRYGLGHDAPSPALVARYQARGEHAMVDIHY